MNETIRAVISGGKRRRAGLLAVAVLGAAASASACGSSAKSPSAASNVATTVPGVASTAELCARFTDTFLQSARDHWADARAEAAYRALVAAGMSVDSDLAGRINELVNAFTHQSQTSLSLRVSNATGAVLARCRQLGHPLTAAQLAELRRLLVSTFEPTTTVQP